jgi:hypothetical protein
LLPAGAEGRTERHRERKASAHHLSQEPKRGAPARLERGRDTGEDCARYKQSDTNKVQGSVA